MTQKYRATVTFESDVCANSPKNAEEFFKVILERKFPGIEIIDVKITENSKQLTIF
jgi:disulfide oxidoreductase YuzD